MIKMTFDEDYSTKLLNTFKNFIDLCHRYDLRYFTCGGTTLGAVRHGGLIPWDDDVDVYMPRCDYEKFLTLNTELKSTKFYIHSLHDSGYYLPFAKFSDQTTTIWENKCYPYVFGVYVDVFPLDFFDLPDEVIIREQYKHQRAFKNYARSLYKYSFADLWCDLTSYRIEFALKKCVCKLYSFRKNQFLKKFRTIQNNVEKSESGKKCVCLTQWEGLVFETNWFSDFIEMPFADFSVRVPVGFDEYLTLLYGDYLQLPPISERKSTHTKYYLNLEEYQSLDKIKSILDH